MMFQRSSLGRCVRIASLAIGLMLSACTGTGTPGEQRIGLQNGAETQACTMRIVRELGSKRDEYKSHVYGSRAQVTTTGAALLVGGTVPKVQTGALETKGRMTSELIWPLVESYRTLRCEMLTVCATMDRSLFLPKNSLERFDLRVRGCEPRSSTPYQQCILSGDHSNSDALAMQNSCRQLVTDTLEFERAALRLGVSYDANYRSLLQSAGMLDWLVKDSSTDDGKGTFIVLRQMINLLGKLHQIPCFTGQCDAPDPIDIGL